MPVALKVSFAHHYIPHVSWFCVSGTWDIPQRVEKG